MIRNDDWFDRWPHDFYPDPDPDPDDDAADADPDSLDVTIDEDLIEDLRSGAMPPTDDQIANILAAWRRGVDTPGTYELILGESDPAVEDWRIAMHQAAHRAGDRKAAEGVRCTCPWYQRAARAVFFPIVRLLARFPWKARSW